MERGLELLARDAVADALVTEDRAQRDAAAPARIALQQLGDRERVREPERLGPLEGLLELGAR